MGEKIGILPKAVTKSDCEGYAVAGATYQDSYNDELSNLIEDTLLLVVFVAPLRGAMVVCVVYGGCSLRN